MNSAKTFLLTSDSGLPAKILPHVTKNKSDDNPGLEQA